MSTELFYSIIENENIKTLFQPIVSLTNGEIFSYEALSRGPANTIYENPLKLIDKADELNESWKLEFIFRKKAIQKYKQLGKKTNLFLNVDPNIMYDPQFIEGCTKELLLSNEKDPSEIIFEITERTAVKDKMSFLKMLEHYRSQSYQIAIDDVGSGYSGFSMIKDTKPEYIKIDMDLIRDIHIDEFKQALMKSFVVLSKTTSIKIIAEGIENEKELSTLIELGVDYGQGFYLAKPNEQLVQLSDKVTATILDMAVKPRICNYDSVLNCNIHHACHFLSA